jgi:hypothetical protein
MPEVPLASEDEIARDREHFYVIHPDARQAVKLLKLVTIGILNSAFIHSRETFRRAVIEGFSCRHRGTQPSERQRRTLRQ